LGKEFNNMQNDFKINVSRGAWVSQSVEHQTLDLSSGLDLRVVSSSPVLGFTLGVETALKKKERNRVR